jgi:hypothetical protein
VGFVSDFDRFIASFKSQSSEAQIIRALRANGSIEARVTEKLLKRGYTELVITNKLPKGAGGRKPYGTNTLEIHPKVLADPKLAAGIVAHETKHFLQKLTPYSYSRNPLKYELEAYQWQRRVDKGYHLRTDLEVHDFLKNSLLYPTIK